MGRAAGIKGCRKACRRDFQGIAKKAPGGYAVFCNTGNSGKKEKQKGRREAMKKSKNHCIGALSPGIRGESRGDREASCQMGKKNKDIDVHLKKLLGNGFGVRAGRGLRWRKREAILDGKTESTLLIGGAQILKNFSPSEKPKRERSTSHTEKRWRCPWGEKKWVVPNNRPKFWVTAGEVFCKEGGGSQGKETGRGRIWTIRKQKPDSTGIFEHLKASEKLGS